MCACTCTMYVYVLGLICFWWYIDVMCVWCCMWENGFTGASVCALLFIGIDAVAAAAAADAAASSVSSFFVGDLQRFWFFSINKSDLHIHQSVVRLRRANNGHFFFFSPIEKRINWYRESFFFILFSATTTMVSENNQINSSYNILISIILSWRKKIICCNEFLFCCCWCYCYCYCFGLLQLRFSSTWFNEQYSLNNSNSELFKWIKSVCVICSTPTNEKDLHAWESSAHIMDYYYS